MAFPKGKKNPNAGRKGYGYEFQEEKLRITAIEKAQKLLDSGKDESGQLLSLQQIDVLKTILSRAIRNRLEHTGKNGKELPLLPYAILHNVSHEESSSPVKEDSDSERGDEREQDGEHTDIPHQSGAR